MPFGVGWQVIMHAYIWGREQSRQRENVKFKDPERELCVARSVKCQVFGAKYERQNMVGNNVIDHTEEQIMEGLVIQCKDL